MHKNKKTKQKFKIYKQAKKEKTSIETLVAAYDNIKSEDICSFEDFPLSDETKRGLRKHNYTIPTEIQRESIGHSLRGRDILGAAKTGSGKTLAFLIPLLEALYRNKWTKHDGVGAIVISPVRELAMQTFQVLNKVGEFHDFSVGLVTGGKDLKFETKRMNQCNIVICTPNRLLHHLDENPLCNCNNLKILILDEADRCLETCFEETMNRIIHHLPEERQTLLFSATQTKSVAALARLSLKNPEFISVHEGAKYTTPEGLIQSFIQCELHDKINFIWSFIKNHKSHKILIFLSSCKQVKYIYESFCRLRPGISLLALYGSLHQLKRMAIYESFCRKQRAVLFATDIAARGLDFPAINWVVQLDCPENANEYIHRAGRTARYERKGESLLVLLPSEMKMVEHLEQKKIPIQEIQVNMTKLQNIQRSLEAHLARDKNLKETAQRAFVAYMKSVFLMKDKEVFNVTCLDTDAFARSLGLAVSPRIRFLQKRLKNQKEKENKDEEKEGLIKMMNDISYNDEIICSDEKQPAAKRKEAKDVRKNTLNFYGGEGDDDDFLQLKRKDHDLDMEMPSIKDADRLESKKFKKPTTRAALVKKLLKKKILPNKKIIFDEAGEVVVRKGKEYISEVAREYEKSNEAGIDIPTAQKVLREEDRYDKEMFRLKIRQKHREERRKQKELRRKEKENETESADEDGGPDLSWLPDPDKLSGKRLASESDDDEIGDNKFESERKRRKDIDSPLPKKKKRGEVLCENDDDDLTSLSRDQELALQIMNLNQ